MSEVKRYKAVINDKPYKPYAYCEESSDGIYVRHDDYAALQQKLDAVLAENVALKEREARLLKNIHEDLQDTDFYLAQLQTPATDAKLNEVRAEAKAKGVEEYAESLSYQALKMREIDHPRIRVASVNAESKRARDFAAQLRAGRAEGGV